MNFNNVKFETSFGKFEQLPKSEMIEIAFSGRSNVGKSSMINKIFNRKQLARVSAVPGKTATINFFSLENVKFVDLPGYGYAKVSKDEKQRWSDLIGGYFADDRNLMLVFQLIDMRHAPTDDDIMMINYLIDNEIPFVIILTKCDKLSNRQQAERLSAFATEIPCGEDVTMVPFSSQTGLGVDKIKEIIEDIAQENLE